MTHSNSTTGPQVMFRPARWAIPRTGVDLTKLSGREQSAAVALMDTDALETLLWERRQAAAA